MDDRLCLLEGTWEISDLYSSVCMGENAVLDLPGQSDSPPLKMIKLALVVCLVEQAYWSYRLEGS